MVPFPSRSTSMIRLFSSSSVGFWPMALITPSNSLDEMAPEPSWSSHVRILVFNWTLRKLIHLVELIKCLFKFSSLYFLYKKILKNLQNYQITSRKTYFDSWLLMCLLTFWGNSPKSILEWLKSIQLAGNYQVSISWLMFPWNLEGWGKIDNLNLKEGFVNIIL